MITQDEERSPARAPLGDFVITVLALIVFVYATIQSFDWPFRAAFIPRIVALAGVVMAVAELGLLWFRGAGAAEEVTTAARAEEAALAETDIEDIGEPAEYAFANTSGVAWATLCAWTFAYFFGVYLVGLLLGSSVFAVAYVWLVGRSRLWSALLYGISLWLLLKYTVVDWLDIVLPEGRIS